MTNTLAYRGTELITVVIFFYQTGPVGWPVALTQLVKHLTTRLSDWEIEGWNKP